MPADWVTTSVTTHMKDAFGAGFNYGYQWWYYEPINMYGAFGHAGQFIFVWPDKDLIYVGTSGATEPTRIAHSTFATILSLNALTVADEPLADNPEGVAKLQAAIAAVQNPAAAEVPPAPDMLTTINGQVYGLLRPDLITGGMRVAWRLPHDDDTWWDTQAMALTFDDSAEASLAVVYADGETELIPVGLDGLYRRSEVRRGLMAAKGAWLDDDTFRIYLKDVNDCVEYRLDMSFAAELLEIIAFESCNGEAVAIHGIMAAE